MRYQVTCSHCGGCFRINAMSGIELQSACPYCGKKLRIKVPATVEKSTYSFGANKHAQTDRHGKGYRGWIFFLLVLMILFSGVFGWNFYQKQVEQKVMLVRQQHRDSLVQIMRDKAALALMSEKQEHQQRLTCAFLKSFYEKAVLTETNPYSYQHYLTEYCKNMIFGLETESSDADYETVWWGTFGTMAGVVDKKALLANLRVSHDEGEWYKVRLSQAGGTEFRRIKVLKERGKLLIDDVK